MTIGMAKRLLFTGGLVALNLGIWVAWFGWEPSSDYLIGIAQGFLLSGAWRSTAVWTRS